jgi:aspartate/glutamate racemase
LRRHGRLGVIAARPTTEGGFFARRFEAAGIGLIRPEEADRAFIHDVYFNDLVKGRFTDEARARLVDVIEQLKTGETFGVSSDVRANVVPRRRPCLALGQLARRRLNDQP